MIKINKKNMEEVTVVDLIDNPELYALCSSFMDAEGNLYIQADDVGNGPFWLKCCDCHFEAMSATNLDCVEPLKVVDIEININVT